MSRKATLEAMLERNVALQGKIIDELTKLENRPEDIYENGDVIFFEKAFHEGGIWYTYAAVKAVGLWYSTGPKAPKGYTWNELLDWMESGAGYREFWHASEWEPVV